MLIFLIVIKLMQLMVLLVLLLMLLLLLLMMMLLLLVLSIVVLLLLLLLSSPNLCVATCCRFGQQLPHATCARIIVGFVWLVSIVFFISIGSFCLSSS